MDIEENLNNVAELEIDVRDTDSPRPQVIVSVGSQADQAIDRPYREELMVASNAAAVHPPLSYDGGEKYETFRRTDTELIIDPEKFYEDEYRSTLHRLIKEIVSKEAPISVSELIVRVSRLHGFAKSGARIRKLLQGIIVSSCNVILEDDKGFVWPNEMQPDQWRWAREFADDTSKRDVDEIALEELIAFARKYSSYPSPIDSVRKALGYARLSKAKKERIEEAMKMAMQNQEFQNSVSPS